MQKLDFSETILEIKNLLLSDDIVRLIDALPMSQAVPQLKELTSIVIQSKSAFDQSLLIYKRQEILDALQAQALYNQNSLGALINTIVQNSSNNSTKQTLFSNPNFLKFYSFHMSLININILCEKVLFQQSIDALYKDEIIIFRIISSESIKLEKLNRVISNIQDLIETILEINQENGDEVEIELLDSGSGINMAVKTTADTAKSLFQIFKEIWDWVVNRKFYKNNLRNSGLMDNLNVMIAIKEAQDKGAINENEAKIFKEKIIRKTEDLLELNVAPKQLIERSVESNSREILLEFAETKMLENKKG